MRLYPSSGSITFFRAVVIVDWEICLDMNHNSLSCFYDDTKEPSTKRRTVLLEKDLNKLSFFENGHASAFSFDDFVAAGNSIKSTIADFASEEIDGLGPTVFKGNVFAVKEVLLTL